MAMQQLPTMYSLKVKFFIILVLKSNESLAIRKIFFFFKSEEKQLLLLSHFSFLLAQTLICGQDMNQIRQNNILGGLDLCIILLDISHLIPLFQTYPE